VITLLKFPTLIYFSLLLKFIDTNFVAIGTDLFVIQLQIFTYSIQHFSFPQSISILLYFHVIPLYSLAFLLGNSTILMEVVSCKVVLKFFTPNFPNFFSSLVYNLILGH
jgi:hypothetical protein